jgi:hypothetical protein
MENFIQKNIIGILVILAIVGYIIYYLFSRRCSECSKFGTLRKTHKELISEKQSKVKETIKTKDSKGNVIRTREVMVPATTKTYKVHFECKFCHSKETKLDTVTSKN